MANYREWDIAQGHIDRALDGCVAPLVCEAGCGSATHLHLPGDARILGIDLSRRQLARYQGATIRTVGDVQSLPVRRGSCDLAVCWEVLEHVPDPAAALHELASTLAPGGVLVVAVPNLWSIKGLVTRLTPHALHVWFYRRVLGVPDAGRHDTVPFPVARTLAIAPGQLRRTATAAGLTPLYEAHYEAKKQARLRDRVGLTGRRWSFVRGLVRGLTLGRINAETTEYLLVAARA